jgi:hypothetical protein
MFVLKISQKCIYLQELLQNIKWMLFLKRRFFCARENPGFPEIEIADRP